MTETGHRVLVQNCIKANKIYAEWVVLVTVIVIPSTSTVWELIYGNMLIYNQSQYRTGAVHRLYHIHRLRALAVGSLRVSLHDGVQERKHSVYVMHRIANLLN